MAKKEVKDPATERAEKWEKARKLQAAVDRAVDAHKETGADLKAAKEKLKKLLSGEEPDPRQGKLPLE
jgi:hypothetical protein